MLERQSQLVAIGCSAAAACPRPASPPSPRRNTVRASPIPKSRSAISCRTAARVRYGVIGEGYFQKVNAEGGINGRKINFISYDDGYSPPKTVELARKLVEGDGVLLIFQFARHADELGNPKIHEREEGAATLRRHGRDEVERSKNFPWTMGWQPNYQSEGRIYAKYILQEQPNGKIGVLYQNDDYGKDYLKGLKDGLGDKAASMIVSRAAYEATDPTIDLQIVNLKASGADVFFDVSTPKFAAQAIRKSAEIGWKPLFTSSTTSGSVGAC